MFLLSAFLFFPLVVAQVQYYNSYDNSVLTAEEVAAYQTSGNSFYCVNSFETCDAADGRTIDGSCNNLEKPYLGTQHYKFLRFLPPVFNGSNPRSASDGSALPNERFVRTRVLAEGFVPGFGYNQLMMTIFEFMALDVSIVIRDDVLNYSNVKTTCCTEAGLTDAQCYPVSVSADDQVHQFSNVRCLNYTRPISFQSTGCLPSTTVPPQRINYGTPFADLSILYGNTDDTSTRQRLFTGGLFNFTMTQEGRQWPQFLLPVVSPSDGIVGISGTSFMMLLWFWREHNRLATELAELNPTWTDEQLFTTARDINIAQFNKIVFYDLGGYLMGTDNLVAEGILGTDKSFRDLYDSSLEPGIYLDGILVFRWIHVVLNGVFRLYDGEGNHYGNIQKAAVAMDYTLINSTDLTPLTRGIFRTPSSKYDNIVNPFVAEKGLGLAQYVSDATTGDLVKTRLYGTAPYVDYLAFCNGGTYETFEDLESVVADKDSIKTLKEIYADVRDIDLMAGLWVEKQKPGAIVSETVYCLLSRFFAHTLKSDRHWFERADRPKAFNAEQLASIHNVNIGSILCNNGEGITEITANPYIVVGPDNPLISCDAVPQLDMSLWQETDDCTCEG